MLIISPPINGTWQDIVSNSYIDWNWNEISVSPFLTWRIVHNNINKHWNWTMLSSNTFQQIKN